MTTGQLRSIILEAVDCLRQRKCRPDRESIAVYVMRKLGSTMNEVFSEIENIVDQGSLLKVEYKGSTSYRSPKNFGEKFTMYKFYIKTCEHTLHVLHVNMYYQEQSG